MYKESIIGSSQLFNLEQFGTDSFRLLNESFRQVCEPIQPGRFKESSQTDIAFVKAPLLYTQQHIMSRKVRDV